MRNGLMLPGGAFSFGWGNWEGSYLLAERPSRGSWLPAGELAGTEVHFMRKEQRYGGLWSAVNAVLSWVLEEVIGLIISSH